jgi:hypothetical protein
VGRVRGLPVYVGNFTYFINFVVLEDVSPAVDINLSNVVLGKQFVEVSRMTYDPTLGLVRIRDDDKEITYQMPQKIEQYQSLTCLEKEFKQSVYYKSDEDKRKGVDYVMRKILGFYKECLQLGPEYKTKLEDDLDDVTNDGVT